MVRAPLSLDRAAAGSVVESPGGSGSTTRRIDPRAALLEATERNAREVREEQDAHCDKNKGPQKGDDGGYDPVIEGSKECG